MSKKVSIPFWEGKPHPIVFVIKSYKEDALIYNPKYDCSYKPSFNRVRKEICRVISNIISIERFFVRDPKAEWPAGRAKLKFLREVLQWCQEELNLAPEQIFSWFDWVEKGLKMRQDKQKKK